MDNKKTEDSNSKETSYSLNDQKISSDSKMEEPGSQTCMSKVENTKHSGESEVTQVKTNNDNVSDLVQPPNLELSFEKLAIDESVKSQAAGEAICSEDLGTDGENLRNQYLPDILTQINDKEITTESDLATSTLPLQKESDQDNDSVLDSQIKVKDGDDVDDDISVQSERECGDGQGDQEDPEASQDQELDHDKDRKNPEYIPRRGAFFEHDTRNLDDYDEEKEKAEEELAMKRDKKKKGKMWEEKCKSIEGKWSHDLFDELEQTPKSTQEIIDTYGYDIRNEEHPPKARRNRRYGRGPNKYTRNWEDEKAYIKTNENKLRQNKGNNSSKGQKGQDRRENNYRRDNTNKIDEEFPPLPNNPSRRSSPPPVQKEKNLVFSDTIGMKCETPWHIPPPPPFSKKNVVSKNSISSKESGTFSKEQSNKIGESGRTFNHSSSVHENVELPRNPPPKQERKRLSTGGGRFVNSMPASIPNTDRTAHFTQGVLPTEAVLNEPEESLETEYEKTSGVPFRGKRYSSQRQTSIPDQNQVGSYKVDNLGPPLSAIPPLLQPIPAQPDQQNQNLSVYNQPASTLSMVPPPPLPVVCQSMPSHVIYTQSPPPPINSDYVNRSIITNTPVYHANNFPPTTPNYQEVPLKSIHTTPAGYQVASQKAFSAPSTAYQEATTKGFQSLPAAYQLAPPKSFPPTPSGYQEPSQNVSNGSGAAPATPMIMPVYVNPPAPSQVPTFTNTSAPSLVNYVPHTFPVVNLPPPSQPEIFRTPSGLTYYSPQDQAVLNRSSLSKRTKSAIPIVPPSEANVHNQNLQEVSSVEINQEEKK